MKPAKNIGSLSMPNTDNFLLPLFSEILCGIGLGCNNAWISMNFKSLSIFADLGGESALDFIYLVSIIAVLVTFLAAVHKQAFLEDRCTQQAWIFAIAVGMTVSTACMPLSGLDSALGITMGTLSGITSGVFSGLFLIYIGYCFSFMTMRSIVIGAAIGSIVSALLFALFLPLSPVPALVTSCAMPIVAAFCMRKGTRRMQLSFTNSFSVESSAQGSDEETLEPAEVKQLALKLALTAALVGFANEAARTLYVQMELVSAGANAYAILQAWSAFFGTIVMIGVALSLLNIKHIRIAARYAYHLLIVTLVLGVILLPAPFIFPELSSYIPHTINSASYTCFGMLFWVITAAFCGHSDGQRIETFAIIRAGWAAGPLLGLLLGRFILSQGIVLQNAYITALICVFAIMIVGAMIFSETDLMKAIDVLPLERKRRFQEKCTRLINAYGLTEREGEIMIMFAKGRNLPYVQETLFLSKSTVSTHRQHIYAKLNIHSQQELIDLVQSFETEMNA